MANWSFVKDPDAVLDYLVDFAALTNGNDDEDYLEAGETISSHTAVAETGLTVDSSATANTNTGVRVWLSGGTINTTYDVTVQIVTSSSRTDDRTFRVRVKEQ